MRKFVNLYFCNPIESVLEKENFSEKWLCLSSITRFHKSFKMVKISNLPGTTKD